MNNKTTDEHSAKTMNFVKFGMLQFSGNSISIDNILIIDDNLDHDAGNNPDPEESHPSKLLADLCIICTAGRISIRANQKMISLYRRDVFIAFSGFIADHFEMSPDARMIIIGINQDFLMRLPLKSSAELMKWLIVKGGLTSIHATESHFNIFIECYRAFRKLHAITDKEFRQEAIIGFIHCVLALFASGLKDHDKEEIKPEISHKKDITVKFLNDVHEFCSTERKISFYAARSFLSPKYFARIITETLGKKPGDIIKENVVLEAKVLLFRKNLSIQQISDKLNFPNASFFCKYFKSVTGCSPLKFRVNGEQTITRR